MKNNVVPMSKRQYGMIPVDQIVVLNPRNRDRRQFAMNVRSIADLGQLKPIVVSARNLDKTGLYELVCGQGRLEAHQQLKRTEIAAEIIHCDKKSALITSLVENIARVPHNAMWFAREMKRMHDDGMTFAKIASIVGKDPTYVSDYINLVEQGESRLIQGVEQGLFSISFATRVAQSDDATIQNVLMDAFDDGMVDSKSVTRVRKLLEMRMHRGKSPNIRAARAEPPPCTIKELAKAITTTTKDKENFVRETTRKENRLIALLMGTSLLLSDDKLLALLSVHNLDKPPELEGEYGVALRRAPGPSSVQENQESRT
ncbi:MAG: ParB N-terminal domain-containing protein [FCB group bacterium]|jgi:ParB family chromosome partitioning protein|nr:ParB N-terminal domain-containing protein [FCB group bacterium]